MLKVIFKLLLGKKLCGVLHRYRILRRATALVKPYFEYDMQRFLNYSGAFGDETKEKLQAKIIILYHVIEKGLTMPNRRLWFGRDVIMALITAVQRFENKYGLNDRQVVHAAGVVRSYYDLHLQEYRNMPAEANVMWNQLKDFVHIHMAIQSANQAHCSREGFYEHREASFFDFAHARHTIRNYAQKELPMQRIRDAVTLALTTPSACNRQYCRVHCINDKTVINELLAIQGGCRGFGHLCNKLLIVTADLEGIDVPRERDDLFTNGGMFLMNLCYSLFYYQVAHCILNWSRTPSEDLHMRKVINIRDSETVIAVLTCGETPDEFDIAASPRKELREILIVH